MVRLTTVLLALSSAGSLVAASSAQAPSARALSNRESCDEGNATMQCVLYGLNCDCAESGTTACSSGGGDCPVSGGGEGGPSGGGGGIEQPPGTGTCDSCGTPTSGGRSDGGDPTGGTDGE